MFPDDDAIFLSIKRFDFIELFYIFSMQYFFMSGLCALVTRFVKSARAYYLIMIIIVFVMLLFSSTLNAPFRAPIVNEDNSSYMGVREGKYWAGAYHDTAFEFLVLLNPQTHLNYLLGYEIYRMQYWIHPELGHVFKVSDEYLRNFFFYDKTSQFAFTLWYPLVFGIAIKLLELRTIY